MPLRRCVVDLIKDLTSIKPIEYADDDVMEQRVKYAALGYCKNNHVHSFDEKSVMKTFANKYTRTLGAATTDRTISYKDFKLLIGRMFALTLYEKFAVHEVTRLTIMSIDRSKAKLR
jgi:hypothetical protein